MEHSDLQSASTYLNNNLLARGLLRDGVTVDFARLAVSGKSKKKSEDGKEVDVGKITVQVMNLVHDLLRRRDRDQDQQEQTAQSILALRAENANATDINSRLITANSDLHRQLAAHQSSSRAAQSAVRAAEASARVLREELARVKIVLTQVRAQCANDVRRRDLELARLKAHLTGQQRGSSGRTGGGGALVAPSCNISHGASTASARAREEEQRLSVQDAGYSLRQETNEFLTQLSQSLSDENDAVIGLVRATVASLRELQGLPEVEHADSGEYFGKTGGAGANASGGLVKMIPTTYDVLAADLEVVLSSLRTILTNPSFTSVEEVHIRDEEILRLRDGWEKMEAKWREAVSMMHGWRKRMLSGGDTVNLDELKMGLNLGEGLKGVDASESSSSGAGKEVGQSVLSDPFVDEDDDDAVVRHDSPALKAAPPSAPPSAKPTAGDNHNNDNTTTNTPPHPPSSPKRSSSPQSNHIPNTSTPSSPPQPPPSLHPKQTTSTSPNPATNPKPQSQSQPQPLSELGHTPNSNRQQTVVLRSKLGMDVREGPGGRTSMGGSEQENERAGGMRVKVRSRSVGGAGAGVGGGKEEEGRAIV